MQYVQWEVTGMHRTTEVRLPEELVRRIDQRVGRRGSDRSRAIEELIETGLATEWARPAGPKLADLLAMATGPCPADTMTDAELAAFAEDEVRAQRAEPGFVSAHA